MCFSCVTWEKLISSISFFKSIKNSFFLIICHALKNYVKYNFKIFSKKKKTFFYHSNNKLLFIQSLSLYLFITYRYQKKSVTYKQCRKKKNTSEEKNQKMSN